ncbi:MAG: protein phosphatase 2C domain-containing protein [Bryobacterales bacterium]|nr:protein phosphatase 2C domain-containing protein [Bryobacterales bacterium]
MRIAPGNAQHIGARQQQQDAFGFSNLADEAFERHAGVLAVVADGMGGMAYGDAASKAAVKAFLEAYGAKTEDEAIPDALLRSILAANTAVFNTATKLGTAGDTGTTLIATVVRDQELHWISAGDSGIFLWRDGEFTLVNDTHIYAHELDARVWLGQISHHVAQAHPEREALTSFLGLDRIPMVDRSRRPFHLQPADIVLLASDGLFKTLSLPDMANAMHLDPQAIAESLVKRALDAKHEYQDNVTVLVIKLDPELAPVAAVVPPTVRASAPEPPPTPLPEPEPPPELPPAAIKPRPTPPRRSRLGFALFLGALLLVAGYTYFVFSYDPTTPQTAPPAPERKGTGEPFDLEKAPPLQRQPGQEPDAATPPAESPAQPPPQP